MLKITQSTAPNCKHCLGSVEDLVPEIILNLLDFIQSAAANTIHQTRLQGMIYFVEILTPPLPPPTNQFYDSAGGDMAQIKV